MTDSLFRPFSESERPFSASRRAFTGVPDSRVPGERQSPESSRPGTAVDAFGLLLNDAPRGFAEHMRNREVLSLKEQVENQLPAGTEADFRFGPYTVFGGMESGLVTSPGQAVIGAAAPENIPTMRSTTMRVTGRAATSQVPSTITVQNQFGQPQTIPVSPTLVTGNSPPPAVPPGLPGQAPPSVQPTRSVDDRPSVIDRIERGDTVRLDRDSISRVEREFFDRGILIA
jgi:hypothetical protein